MYQIPCRHQITMDNLKKNPVSDGYATPNSMFQDALENQVPSSNVISNALGTYLQTRHIEVTEKINPPAQTPIQLNLGYEDEFNDTTLMLPNTKRTHQSREMKNLQPANRPGLSELAPLKPTRSRSPSYQKAKTIYDEALVSIKEELEEFNAQNYVNILLENMSSTDIRPRYRKMKTKEIVLISA